MPNAELTRYHLRLLESLAAGPKRFDISRQSDRATQAGAFLMELGFAELSDNYLGLTPRGRRFLHDNPNSDVE